MDQEPLHRGFAEFVGTFAVVFVAAGSLLVVPILFAQFYVPQAGPTGPPFASGLALVATALAYGVTFAIMVSAVGHISGGHFNPAVTLGFVITRRIAPLLAVVYWVAQFGAAALAALLLRWIFPSAARNAANLGAPTKSVLINDWRAVVLEAVITFILVWVVFATAADPRGSFKQIAGLAVGLAVTVGVFVGGALTGGMMNPARAFGPQLVQSHWTDWWVWYLGPFAGAAIAALVYEMLYLSPTLRPRLPVGPPEAGVVETAPGEAALE
jgi:aquaporin TIP